MDGRHDGRRPGGALRELMMSDRNQSNGAVLRFVLCLWAALITHEVHLSTSYPIAP